MSSDCTITARLLSRQATVFRLAERDHGITQKLVHLETRMSLSAIGQYARGETAMSGPALLKLLAMPQFPAALLSLLFEGTGRHVADDSGDSGDHEATADNCVEFTGRYAAARKDASEAGPAIGPNEDRELRACARKLVA